ncbi:radical SAM protein [Helicobacter burdigaliensis]|uniref:radical SAM protein n=1 Tax=Helicobacter burdigaliensis TaxID=2315334 RepID=UPI000EF6EBD4|nr:radical SAM protein [Helicobacter burdigaliensis]
MNFSNYLSNPTFIERYIQANIYRYSRFLKGERNLARIYKLPIAFFAKKFFLENYFKKRVLEGKIDIPYLELVLTTKCTMRCESCMNLMQYFSSSNQYSATFEGIKESIETLLSKVDTIAHLRIIGGEPLIFKDLPKLVNYLGAKKQILTLNIVTNGTLEFKEELLLSLKAIRKKAKVTISDYSFSPNLKLTLKHNQIFNALKKNKIPYQFLWGAKDATWKEPGKIYKRNRTKEENIANFKACGMICVSLMSSEGFNDEGQKNLAKKGAIFVCPVASSLSRLKGLEEFSGDFINLEEDKSRFFDFYAQEFFKACDYCHDYAKERGVVPVAIQTKKVLELKPD